MSLRLMSAVISASVPVQQNRRDDSDKLLKLLLECVQDCQKRYGGKTELATEFDSCVVALCLTLEQVFLHGLRIKPHETQQTSTLKQVSEIVTTSLHIGSDIPSFWPFVNKHLTKHEQERYAILKQIWTDIGKGRAWIRSSLNEHSLERNIHTILSNSAFLKTYYEDWALLRDQEKSSMLPNMAAGLGAILFAINIDKPDLNSCVIQKLESIIQQSEPIIEAPLPENNLRKKNKKVARQFICFDEDSMLSSSVPSSSGSMSSDTSSLNNENQLSKTEIPSSSEKTETTDTVNRKLSMEMSGTREKYSSEVPKTLTPVTQSEIGELKPVSVEINKHFEFLNISDGITDAPIDVSAVMIASEAKTQDKVRKLQHRIDMLEKENEVVKEQVIGYIKKQNGIDLLEKENDLLKDQVKTYISAMQNLNKDDLKEEKSELKNQPDYKAEAKIFEQKLVQVAEMHAELMGFNVALQQSLSKKDALLDRLKAELESLRGPVPTDDVNFEEGSGYVNVWIPSAFLTGPSSSSHHVYQIFLRAGNDEWNVYRRYAQFHALHSDLKKLDPAVSNFDFPPKKSIGKKESGLVEDRRKRLQIYLRKILAHWPELSHCNSRFLLEQHLAFFKDQKEVDVKNKKSNIFSKRGGAGDNHYTGL